VFTTSPVTVVDDALEVDEPLVPLVADGVSPLDDPVAGVPAESPAEPATTAAGRVVEWPVEVG
jgi:hypothetical protein